MVLRFFDHGSPYFTHPLLTPERSAAELDRIDDLVGPLGGPVLDVGCGFGRHLLELERRGIPAVGIEPSSAMVDRARAAASALGLQVDARHGGAELLSTTRAPSGFALALCLFTTFGQRDPLQAIDPTDQPERRTLDAIAGALTADGTLVIEVPDRAKIVDSLVEGETLGTTTVERRFDAETAVVHERFELDGGEVFVLAYRVFDQRELARLLIDAGFDVDHVIDGALVPPPPTFMTVFGRKSR